MTHKQNHKNKSKKEKNTSNSVVLIKHSIANKTKREIQTCAQKIDQNHKQYFQREREREAINEEIVHINI